MTAFLAKTSQVLVALGLAPGGPCAQSFASVRCTPLSKWWATAGVRTSARSIS